MADLWDDLLACLDLLELPSVGFEGRSQQLSYHRLFGGQLLAQPQSFRGLEVRLLIVPVPGFRFGVRLPGECGRVALPGVPGAHRLRPRRAGLPLALAGWFVLVRLVLAERRAAASR